MTDYNINNAKNDIENLQEQNSYDFQEIKRLDRLINEYDKRVTQAINMNNQINEKIQDDYEKFKKSIIDDNVDFGSGGGEGIGLTPTQLNNINKIPTIQNTIDNLPNAYATKSHTHSAYAKASHKHDASEIENLPTGGGAGLSTEQAQQLQTAYQHSQSDHVTMKEVDEAITNAQLVGGEVDTTRFATNLSLTGSNLQLKNSKGNLIGNAIILPTNGGGNITNITRPVFSTSNPHASNCLNIETYEGGQNQPMHPKVLYFENGWNGYKYWMAYTPLPNEDNENPCIAVSNDMVIWTIPDGLENPLAFKPSTGGYNSDTHLVYRTDTNTLECWYRRIYTGVQKEELFRRTSTDGVNWTTEESCFISEGSITQNLSPSIIFEEGKYKMWTCSNSTTIRYYEGITGKDFSKIRDIIFTYGSTAVWHQDVIHTANGYEMLNYNNNGTLHYCKSDDNISYSKPVLILEKTNNADDWCSQNLYRSSFFIKDGYYYIFYSGQKMNTLEWKIGLTRGANPYKLEGLESVRTLGVEEAILELYNLIGNGGGVTTVPVENIALNKNILTLKTNDTYELIVSFTPTNSSNKTITWTSDNPQIATVENGIVTAKGEGSCIITAKSNNGKTATCNLTISAQAVTPTDGVVQENLICWLDGRDGNASQTEWSDRTTNKNDMILKGFSFDNSSGWTGTGLKFDGIKDYCISVTPNQIKGYGTKNPNFITVCLNVTINQINKSQQDLLSLMTSNKGRFIMLQDNDITYQKSSLNKTGVIAKVGETYDLVYIYRSNIHVTTDIQRSAIYVNNVLKFEEKTDNHKVIDSNSFNFSIGSEGGTTAFASMTVNSVKIYDGELTDEQIQQNYEYEKSIQR